MATIIFTSSQGRLTVRGPCRDEDFQHVLDALEAFGRADSPLVLDLCRLTALSRRSARSLLLLCRDLEDTGIVVSLLVRPHSAVDRSIRSARTDLDRPTPLTVLRAVVVDAPTCRPTTRPRDRGRLIRVFQGTENA